MSLFIPCALSITIIIIALQATSPQCNQQDLTLSINGEDTQYTLLYKKIHTTGNNLEKWETILQYKNISTSISISNTEIFKNLFLDTSIADQKTVSISRTHPLLGGGTLQKIYSMAVALNEGDIQAASKRTTYIDFSSLFPEGKKPDLRFCDIEQGLSSTFEGDVQFDSVEMDNNEKIALEATNPVIVIRQKLSIRKAGSIHAPSEEKVIEYIFFREPVPALPSQLRVSFHGINIYTPQKSPPLITRAAYIMSGIKALATQNPYTGHQHYVDGINALRIWVPRIPRHRIAGVPFCTSIAVGAAAIIANYGGAALYYMLSSVASGSAGTIPQIINQLPELASAGASYARQDIQGTHALAIGSSMALSSWFYFHNVARKAHQIEFRKALITYVLGDYQYPSVHPFRAAFSFSPSKIAHDVEARTRSVTLDPSERPSHNNLLLHPTFEGLRKRY